MIHKYRRYGKLSWIFPFIIIFFLSFGVPSSADVTFTLTYLSTITEYVREVNNSPNGKLSSISTFATLTPSRYSNHDRLASQFDPSVNFGNSLLPSETSDDYFQTSNEQSNIDVLASLQYDVSSFWIASNVQAEVSSIIGSSAVINSYDLTMINSQDFTTIIADYQEFESISHTDDSVQATIIAVQTESMISSNDSPIMLSYESQDSLTGNALSSSSPLDIATTTGLQISQSEHLSLITMTELSKVSLNLQSLTYLSTDTTIINSNQLVSSLTDTDNFISSFSLSRPMSSKLLISSDTLMTVLDNVSFESKHLSSTFEYLSSFFTSGIPDISSISLDTSARISEISDSNSLQGWISDNGFKTTNELMYSSRISTISLQSVGNPPSYLSSAKDLHTFNFDNLLSTITDLSSIANILPVQSSDIFETMQTTDTAIASTIRLASLDDFTNSSTAKYSSEEISFASVSKVSSVVSLIISDASDNSVDYSTTSIISMLEYQSPGNPTNVLSSVQEIQMSNSDMVLSTITGSITISKLLPLYSSKMDETLQATALLSSNKLKSVDNDKGTTMTNQLFYLTTLITADILSGSAFKDDLSTTVYGIQTSVSIDLLSTRIDSSKASQILLHQSSDIVETSHTINPSSNLAKTSVDNSIISTETYLSEEAISTAIFGIVSEISYTPELNLTFNYKSTLTYQLFHLTSLTTVDALSSNAFKDDLSTTAYEIHTLSSDILQSTVTNSSIVLQMLPLQSSESGSDSLPSTIIDSSIISQAPSFQSSDITETSQAISSLLSNLGINSVQNSISSTEKYLSDEVFSTPINNIVSDVSDTFETNLLSDYESTTADRLSYSSRLETRGYLSTSAFDDDISFTTNDIKTLDSNNLLSTITDSSTVSQFIPLQSTDIAETLQATDSILSSLEKASVENSIISTETYLTDELASTLIYDIDSDISDTSGINLLSDYKSTIADSLFYRTTLVTLDVLSSSSIKDDLSIATNNVQTSDSDSLLSTILDSSIISQALSFQSSDITETSQAISSLLSSLGITSVQNSISSTEKYLSDEVFSTPINIVSDVSDPSAINLSSSYKSTTADQLFQLTTLTALDFLSSSTFNNELSTIINDIQISYSDSPLSRIIDSSTIPLLLNTQSLDTIETSQATVRSSYIESKSADESSIQPTHVYLSQKTLFTQVTYTLSPVLDTLIATSDSSDFNSGEAFVSYYHSESFDLLDSSIIGKSSPQLLTTIGSQLSVDDTQISQSDNSLYTENKLTSKLQILSIQSSVTTESSATTKFTTNVPLQTISTEFVSNLPRRTTSSVEEYSSSESFGPEENLKSLSTFLQGVISTSILPTSSLSPESIREFTELTSTSKFSQYLLSTSTVLESHEGTGAIASPSHSSTPFLSSFQAATSLISDLQVQLSTLTTNPESTPFIFTPTHQFELTIGTSSVYLQSGSISDVSYESLALVPSLASTSGKPFLELTETLPTISSLQVISSSDAGTSISLNSVVRSEQTVQETVFYSNIFTSLTLPSKGDILSQTSSGSEISTNEVSPSTSSLGLTFSLFSSDTLTAGTFHTISSSFAPSIQSSAPLSQSSKQTDSETVTNIESSINSITKSNIQDSIFSQTHAEYSTMISSFMAISSSGLSLTISFSSSSYHENLDTLSTFASFNPSRSYSLFSDGQSLESSFSFSSSLLSYINTEKSLSTGLPITESISLYSANSQSIKLSATAISQAGIESSSEQINNLYSTSLQFFTSPTAAVSQAKKESSGILFTIPTTISTLIETKPTTELSTTILSALESDSSLVPSSLSGFASTKLQQEESSYVTVMQISSDVNTWSSSINIIATSSAFSDNLDGITTILSQATILSSKISYNVALSSRVATITSIPSKIETSAFITSESTLIQNGISQSFSVLSSDASVSAHSSSISSAIIESTQSIESNIGPTVSTSSILPTSPPATTSGAISNPTTTTTDPCQNQPCGPLAICLKRDPTQNNTLPYYCQCRIGYYPSNLNVILSFGDNCIVGLFFYGYISLNLPFNIEFNNPNNGLGRAIRQQSRAQVTSIIRNSKNIGRDFVHVIIIGLRPGSTIVDFYIVYKNNATATSENIQLNLQEGMQSIDGYNITRTNVTIADVCQAENDPCSGLQQVCLENKNRFICESCPTGYQFNATIKNCLDIDECIFDSNPCNVSEECINTDGSYLCIPRSKPTTNINSTVLCSDYCQHGGNCNVDLQTNEVLCSCTSLYTGDKCERLSALGIALTSTGGGIVAIVLLIACVMLYYRHRRKKVYLSHLFDDVEKRNEVYVQTNTAYVDEDGNSIHEALF